MKCSGRSVCGSQRVWDGLTWKTAMGGSMRRHGICGWQCQSPSYFWLFDRSLRGGSKATSLHHLSFPLCLTLGPPCLRVDCFLLCLIFDKLPLSLPLTLSDLFINRSSVLFVSTCFFSFTYQILMSSLPASLPSFYSPIPLSLILSCVFTSCRCFLMHPVILFYYYEYQS